MINLKNDSPRVSLDAKQKDFLKLLKDQASGEGSVVPFDFALDFLDKDRLVKLITKGFVCYQVDYDTIALTDAGLRASK